MQASSWLRRSGAVLLWVLTGLTALSMADAGWGKFESFDGWQHWFERWGYGAWSAQIVGVLEMAGAVGLLFRRSRLLSGGVLAIVMVGAAYTTAFKESDLSTTDPLVMLVLIVTTVGFWRLRERVGRRDRQDGPDRGGA